MEVIGKQNAGRTAAAMEQAGQWLARLHGPDLTARDRAGFEQWLAKDRQNAASYRHVEQLWRDLALVGTLGEVDIDRPSLQRRLLSRPMRRGSMAAAAAIATLTAWLAFIHLHGADTRYATQVAQVRELTLPDGSQVTLGARSSLEVDFATGRRGVKLTSGEAFFSVVKDPSRPFVVMAGAAEVRVLGTQFDVRRAADEVRIAVSDGAVEVIHTAAASESSRSAARKHLLTAGQALVASTSRLSIQAVGRAEPGAWRRGRLSYENASLGEVIADINRYSSREIVFADERLRAVRVTTAFGTGQIEEMLAGLAATQPISVDRSHPERIVLAPQN